ncbi:hypothetical protein FRC03_009966 [Tulasnella sp. 419]|nr:hypothetical protein FRC03_009966 [Tulasnella sp. 419]
MSKRQGEKLETHLQSQWEPGGRNSSCLAIVSQALTLLDYCLHAGSENVVLYCKDNLYVIKTLKEFQYIDEDMKDQDANVRQRAKDITNHLMDEGHLREQGTTVSQTFVINSSIDVYEEQHLNYIQKYGGRHVSRCFHREIYLYNLCMKSQVSSLWVLLRGHLRVSLFCDSLYDFLIGPFYPPSS